MFTQCQPTRVQTRSAPADLAESILTREPNTYWTFIKGDNASVKLVISSGSYPEITYKLSNTTAAWSIDLTRVLIEKVCPYYDGGIKTLQFFLGHHSKTPLFEAVQTERWEFILLLIKANANINVNDDNGVTLLSYAKKMRDEITDPQQRIRYVKCHKIFLMLESAGPMFRPAYWVTLFKAFEKIKSLKIMHVIEFLRSHHFDNMNAINDIQNRMESLSLEASAEDLSRLCNDYCEALKHVSNKNGRTPLHMAIMVQNGGDHANFYMGRIIDRLVDAGEDVNKADIDGKTPLHMLMEAQGFASAGFDDLVVKLLNAGGDPRMKDHHGKTPLDIANSRAGFPTREVKLLKEWIENKKQLTIFSSSSPTLISDNSITTRPVLRWGDSVLSWFRKRNNESYALVNDSTAELKGGGLGAKGFN